MNNSPLSRIKLEKVIHELQVRFVSDTNLRERGTAFYLLYDLLKAMCHRTSYDEGPDSGTPDLVFTHNGWLNPKIELIMAFSQPL